MRSFASCETGGIVSHFFIISNSKIPGIFGNSGKNFRVHALVCSFVVFGVFPISLATFIAFPLQREYTSLVRFFLLQWTCSFYLQPIVLMSFKNYLLPVCLLSLFLVASAQPQDAPAPSLNSANTIADVANYINAEAAKLDLESMKPVERAPAIAGILIPASDKILEFAASVNEKQQAYSLKMRALSGLVQVGIEGAEQKYETFLGELAAQKDFEEMEEMFRFRHLVMLMILKEDDASAQKLEAFIKALDAKEKNEARIAIIQTGRFLQFGEKAKKAEITPQNFAQFQTELKGWLAHLTFIPITEIASLGFEIAYRYKVPAEQIAKELTEHIQSPQVQLPEEEKKKLLEVFALLLRLAPGVDPKLYGKTLDDKDFDWATLRGKYVLIKFTATWCGPCKMELPNMREVYAKYKDKGLEIVSVYVWEAGAEPVASVKQVVEEEKLPWIVLSEALTAKANQPSQGEFYGIQGVPTIVLVDKEGKIMSLVRDDWKKKIEEIFADTVRENGG